MSKPTPTGRQSVTLSMALQREIREFREEFLPYVNAAQIVTAKRKDIAPPFMKLYRRFKRETGGTFVAFVRELDPNMPTDRDTYPNHSSYQSALYLKRLAEAPHTTPAHRTTASPFRVLAYVMDTLLHYAKKHEVEMWQSFKRVSRWDDRQIVKLQTLMKRVHPLAIPGAPRLVKRQHARAS